MVPTSQLTLMSHRNWCFTCNNPVTANLLQTTAQVKFLVQALERGEGTGTLHYQGYVELKTSRNLNQTKRIFSSMVHLEPRRGSRAQAISYVLKTYLEGLKASTNSLDSSTDLEYITNLPTTGSIQSELPALCILGFSGTYKELASLSQVKTTVKQRLSRAKDLLEAGKTQLDIANEDFELWVKYHKAFQHYALLSSQPRITKTEICVIQGPTGSGKSHYCREYDSEAYWKPRSNWWDGYTNQSTVIIDEFYGWLPYDLLLRLGDQYPLQVEVKGGSVNFNSKKLFITTNKHPSTWYKEVYFEAFIRRVEIWIIMKQRGSFELFTDYTRVPFINI